MSGDSLAFRLAAASFFQENGKDVRILETRTADEEIYIYAPENDASHVTEVLKRTGVKHTVNQYGINDYRGKTLLFFKRSDLSQEQVEFLIEAASAGANVEPLLNYLDRRLNFVEVELLHGDYLLDNNLFRLALGKRRLWQKRLVDSFFAIFLLVLTLPVWLLTALAIKLESNGPIFFRQRRTGLFNEEFEIIKFRSMRQDAEKDGARWASRNDNRITSVGNFIRKTRIDELPQLLNVLKGEMSMIGPRPEREVFIRDLENHIPFYRFRHMVKPGITGLAQVKYAYGASIEDAMYKHRHDIYYIKHQTLWMDLKILAHTIRIVVTGQGV
jgi:exopolysaccharide biosynthesis polyprenyl glycosylphosphotransferase